MRLEEQKRTNNKLQGGRSYGSLAARGLSQALEGQFSLSRAFSFACSTTTTLTTTVWRFFFKLLAEPPRPGKKRPGAYFLGSRYFPMPAQSPGRF